MRLELFTHTGVNFGDTRAMRPRRKSSCEKHCKYADAFNKTPTRNEKLLYEFTNTRVLVHLQKGAVILLDFFLLPRSNDKIQKYMYTQPVKCLRLSKTACITAAEHGILTSLQRTSYRTFTNHIKCAIFPV